MLNSRISTPDSGHFAGTKSVQTRKHSLRFQHDKRNEKDREKKSISITRQQLLKNDLCDDLKALWTDKHMTYFRINSISALSMCAMRVMWIAMGFIKNIVWRGKMLCIANFSGAWLLYPEYQFFSRSFESTVVQPLLFQYYADVFHWIE